MDFNKDMANLNLIKCVTSFFPDYVPSLIKYMKSAKTMIKLKIKHSSYNEQVNQVARWILCDNITCDTSPFPECDPP